MLIIPFLILLLFFGLLITILLKVKVGLAERLSLSYLLGIGLFTFFIFAFDLLFSIDYDINNTFSLLVSLCTIFFTIKYKDTIEFFKGVKFNKKKPKTIIIVFWGIILSLFIYTLVTNIYWPVHDWDALALYDFRARALMIDANIIHAASNDSYFMGYPLLTSLAHLFSYQVGLESPKFIYSLFYLSFLIIFYFSLRRNASEKVSIFTTIILALIPEVFAHSTMAYTNLAYSVYFVTGLLYLYAWIKTKVNVNLLISAILIGLSLWVRIAEPFWLVALIPVAIVSWKRKMNWGSLLYAFTIMLFYLPWKYFTNYINKLINYTPGITTQSLLSSVKEVTIDRILLVLNFLYRYVFSTWGLLFLIFVLSGLGLIINKSKQTIIIFFLIIILLLAIIFAGTFAFFIVYPEWQLIPDSARRMSMFLIPIMLYSIAITISNEKNS